MQRLDGFDCLHRLEKQFPAGHTNALNQYTDRENNTLAVSGTAEVDGGGSGGTAVVVAGGTLTPAAASRQGRYWNTELTVDNNQNPASPNPWRGPLSIYTAKRGTTDIFRVDSRIGEIAARVQTFTYDYSGNMTSDGVVDYQWDAENRLIRMETTANAVTFGFPHKIIEFKYDYMGRRVQKRVLDGGPSPAVEISCRRFLYDGWNLIAEYNAAGGTSIGSLVRSYTWGLDIVNSMTSAGGVGALLQIADHASGKTFLPTYDGNGNIASLINAVSGDVAAVYEYSPYGEPLRAQISDQTVADNPFRFSTKYTDVETGLVYYGLRYYDPKNGRFINQDPIRESGGLNLYGFVGNNPINSWDYLGMDPWVAVQYDGTNWAAYTHSLETSPYRYYFDYQNVAGEGGSDEDIFNYDYGVSSGDISTVSDAITGQMVNAGIDGEVIGTWGQAFGTFASDLTNTVSTVTAAVSQVFSSLNAGTVQSGNGTDASVTTRAGEITAQTVATGTSQANSLDLSSIGKGPLLAANGDGIYTDGSIPWATAGKGSEANAAGKGALDSASTVSIAVTSGTYYGVMVVLPDGTRYMPVTTVKNQAQADRLGVEIGTVAPIFVPPGQNPQGMINQWADYNLPHPIEFYNTWKPGGPNDYKLSNPIYDAYGNFEYGATGTAGGFADNNLRGIGDLVHGGTNNPINTRDIQSGIDAVKSGGQVTTVPVHFP